MVFKYLSIEVQQTKKHFYKKNGVQKEIKAFPMILGGYPSCHIGFNLLMRGRSYLVLWKKYIFQIWLKYTATYTPHKSKLERKYIACLGVDLFKSQYSDS